MTLADTVSVTLRVNRTFGQQFHKLTILLRKVPNGFWNESDAVNSSAWNNSAEQTMQTRKTYVKRIKSQLDKRRKFPRCFKNVSESFLQMVNDPRLSRKWKLQEMKDVESLYCTKYKVIIHTRNTLPFLRNLYGYWSSYQTQNGFLICHYHLITFPDKDSQSLYLPKRIKDFQLRKIPQVSIRPQPPILYRRLV